MPCYMSYGEQECYRTEREKHLLKHKNDLSSKIRDLTTEYAGRNYSDQQRELINIFGGKYEVFEQAMKEHILEIEIKELEEFLAKATKEITGD